MDHILLEHIISTHEPCDLRLSQGRLVGKFGFGLGFKKNSNLTNLFSVGVLRMRENLEINQLYEKWIKQDGLDTPPKCNQNDEEANTAVTESNKLTFDNLKGLFLLVWGSLILGFLFLIVEWIVACYTLLDSKSGSPKTMVDAFKLRLKYMRQNQKIIRQRYKTKRNSFSRYLSPISKVYQNDRNGSQ
ncbi:Oidioi.mRNA.OKI2018_I69.PAR.g9373.t1.cds [Oikopleura dioica]|uniref:Oidioi.mRNA.OKI2018_I69.PAR.g9373.t1.cds n=1 Tax=Oikopleura dioica TaxID=34765 RepID=A0ABN7RPP7_OIKDI|nr:Oidioi.mRNA.OKI2018_I69.PAR.g9373.t1.cds [Oikopleura dioica]